MHLLESTKAANPDEVAHLAYVNWLADGCPEGHDQDYWLEAEQQITATKHLLLQEIKQHWEEMQVAAQSNPKETQKNPGRRQAR